MASVQTRNKNKRSKVLKPHGNQKPEEEKHIVVSFSASGWLKDNLVSDAKAYDESVVFVIREILENYYKSQEV